LDSAVPGIFTINQAGTGQGAILIGDTDILAAPAGSIAGRTSRPARRSEVVTIFGTGLGGVNPPLVTGQAAIFNQTVVLPTVTIDGIPAMVGFAGRAPNFVGLDQINVTIPENTRFSDDVPVVVRVGGKQSNIATLAVGP
jgi:uncharacterized protein (TIGR03437 family)